VQLSLHQFPAQVVPMPKTRLPHEFAPVSPETLREAEDLRRERVYGSAPESVVVDPAGRTFLRVVDARVIPPARASVDERVACMTALQALIKRFTFPAVLRALQCELAVKGIDITLQTIDDLAQIEEQP
jgi:hypothetical protein